jgi:hypothetical protein
VSDSRNICPSCQSALGFKPWDGDLASDEICPHCGIQFGYDDAAGGSPERQMIYRLWREAWIANGRQPLSKEMARRVAPKAIDY